MGFLRNLLTAEASHSRPLETFSVRLPDGRIVSRQIPVGATDAEVRRAFAEELASAGFQDPQRHEVRRPPLEPGSLTPPPEETNGPPLFGPGTVGRGRSAETIVENALTSPSRQARFQAPVSRDFVPSGSLRPYYPTFSERIENRIREGLLGLGASRYTAQDLSGVARDVPLVGDAMTAGDAGGAFARGDVLEGSGLTGLAAVGLVPGLGDAAAAGGRRGLAEARRAARARFLGYSDRPFWRGEREAGPLPDRYPTAKSQNRDTFFSRNPETAHGVARLGGRPQAREFRLNPGRSFNVNAPTLRDYADVVTALRRLGDERGARYVAATLPVEPMDWTPDTLLALSDRFPEERLRGAGGLLHHAIGINSRFTLEHVLRQAGFRSVDFGDDLQMLTGSGIRLRTARFDPARRESTNIHHSLVPAGLGLGLAGYANSGEAGAE